MSEDLGQEAEAVGHSRKGVGFRKREGVNGNNKQITHGL